MVSKRSLLSSYSYFYTDVSGSRNYFLQKNLKSEFTKPELRTVWGEYCSSIRNINNMHDFTWVLKIITVQLLKFHSYHADFFRNIYFHKLGSSIKN